MFSFGVNNTDAKIKESVNIGYGRLVGRSLYSVQHVQRFGSLSWNKLPVTKYF